MSAEELKENLETLIEIAFREGALWQKCGGEALQPMSDAMKTAQLKILSQIMLLPKENPLCR